MTRPVRFRPSAAEQVEKAHTWWRDHRPAARFAVRDELARATALIAVQPGLGAPATNARLNRRSATPALAYWLLDLLSRDQRQHRRSRFLARQPQPATASALTASVTQMNARSRKRLKREVGAWAAETRHLVEASRLLIEYFGTKKELQSWDAAIEAPMAWVSIVARQYEPRAHHQGPLPPLGRGSPLSLFRGDREDSLASCRDRRRTGREVRAHDPQDPPGVRSDFLPPLVWPLLDQLRRCGHPPALDGVPSLRARRVEGLLP